MNVQHNIPGMNNVRIGKGLNDKMTKAMRRLSTGTRVAIAADDAAGLAVSEKIRNLLAEQTRCVTNAEEGVCVAQTADAALNEVSDMMHRAQQLCIQAGNGTYSDSDRAALTKEINQLYDEMERIFTTAEFNDIKLFNAAGYNPAGEDSVIYEYIETVRDVAQGDPLESWGNLDFINNKQFDLAKDATNASVSLKLDSGVNLRDAATLDGKHFMLSRPGKDSVRFTFDSGTVNSRLSWESGSEGYYYNYTIGTKDCSTVQDVLDLVVSRTNSESFLKEYGYRLDSDKTVLDSSNRTITFTFGVDTLVQTINGSSYRTENAAGADDNAITISNKQDATLAPVDGENAENNKTVYTDTVKGSVDLLPGRSGTLSSNDIDALVNNALVLDGKYRIEFTADPADPANAGKVDISGMDADSVRNAAVQAINQLKDSEGRQAFTASLSDGKLQITGNNRNTNSLHYGYVYEDVSGEEKTTNSIPISVQKTPATGEKGCVFTVNVGNFELPASVTVSGTTISFVESFPNISVDGMDGNYAQIVADKNGAISQIASWIRSYYPDTSVSVSNSTITVTGKYAAQDMDIAVSGGTGRVEVSQRVLMNNTYEYLGQTASIPLDLSQAMSSETALADLNGKGFGIDRSGSKYYFEFVNAPGTRTNPNATEIDVSGCTSYDDIAARMQDVLDNRFSGLEVTHNGSGAMTIQVPAGTSTINFVDGLEGLDGLFLDSAGSATYAVSGGTNATQPQTAIDFSRFNETNFDELYGKGFRITCATCEGEFINVIFCHDVSASGFPDSKIETVDAHGNPITFTNYAVELKNMRSGSDIVRNIVDQLKGKLDHFTDVEVGDPSSVLKVMDKRAGNIEKDGTILRAEILSGVYTNCTYDLVVNEYINQNAIIGGGNGTTTAYYGYCPIYLGSTDDEFGSWVSIHLPTLSLKLLNLDPPRPDMQDVSSISDTLERLKNAEEVILTARAAMGADQNRLEHARESLKNSAEQSTASYSTIKDADMAVEMTEMTKLSILQNFQQATLSHIFDNASSVLKLLY